jgi:hypothetical protein
MGIYKYGKHPKKEDMYGRTLKAARYMVNLPQPPDMSDTLSRVLNNLKISSVGTAYPMDGNDKVGDCVMAGSAHTKTTWNGMIVKKNIPSKCDVLKQYYRLTGGGDTGLNMLDTLNYWHNKGFFGEKIPGYVENDTKNIIQLKQSIWLFGSILVGMQVQEKDQYNFEHGYIWTIGNIIPNEGHCVEIISYDAEYVTVLTWGGMVKATWDWVVNRLDESYTILPLEAKVNGFSPNFPWEALQADIAAVSK